MAAVLVAFITSLDEVAVSLFISVGQRATVIRPMFESLRDQVDPTIPTALIVLSVLCVIVYSMLVVLPGR